MSQIRSMENLRFVSRRNCRQALCAMKQILLQRTSVATEHHKVLVVSLQCRECLAAFGSAEAPSKAEDVIMPLFFMPFTAMQGGLISLISLTTMSPKRPSDNTPKAFSPPSSILPAHAPCRRPLKQIQPVVECPFGRPFSSVRIPRPFAA